MYKPTSYLKGNDKPRNDANDIIEEFSDELGKMSGRYLDIGSGSCDTVIDFVSPKLNPKASIVCSDISKPMLNFGKQKYGANERTSFLELDIETLELPEDIKQFDHITSFYCLHWCKDMRRVFKNISKLFQPGGTTLLVFASTNATFTAYSVLAAMPCYQPYMMNVDRYISSYLNTKHQRETMKNLLRDVGFKVRHFSRRERSYVLRTPALVRGKMVFYELQLEASKCMAIISGSYVLSVRRTYIGVFKCPQSNGTPGFFVKNLGENTLYFLLPINSFIDGMPVDLRKEYKKDLVKKYIRGNIIFYDNDNNGSEYSILSRYHLLIAYSKKPMSK